MNVERDDLEDRIKGLEEQLEKTKEMKKMRDILIKGIQENLSVNLSLDCNVHESNNMETYTFDIKANDYRIEIKITGEIK